MTARTIRWFAAAALVIWATVAVPGTKALGASTTLAALTALGSGASAGALSSCPSGLCPGSDSCTCVPLSGTGKGSSIGNVNFSTTFVLDTSEAIGACVGGFGTLALTSTTKSSNALVMEYSGSVCGVGENLVFNGAFFIDASKSTGKYAGASGSGNVAGSENLTSGAILGNINGTLLP